MTSVGKNYAPCSLSHVTLHGNGLFLKYLHAWFPCAFQQRSFALERCYVNESKGIYSILSLYRQGLGAVKKHHYGIEEN